MEGTGSKRATIQAMILDLDGVITHTAKLHSVAWKRLFDGYDARRQERGQAGYAPFTMDRDYHLYVDGKPRQDGVKSFLESRGISLPMGQPDDPVEEETLQGLANLKNSYFATMLREQGPEVFPDAVEALHRWRQLGLKIAVASSSKNCEEVLRLAKLEELFDVRVDGTHLQRWNMPGKPAPDIFLAAARQLGVEPRSAAVFEDATVGVEAAIAGGFGLVIGVARCGSAEEPLRRAGAHLVVTQLTEVRLDGMPGLPVAGERARSKVLGTG